MKFHQFCSFIVSVIIALALGAIITLSLLTFDQPFKKVVENQVKKIFRTSFKSNLEGKVKRVNVLTGEIELESVTVTCPFQSDAWQWKAEKFTLQFSWLSYLLKKKFDVYVYLDSLESHSHIQNSQILIIEHLQNFIAGAAGYPATLKMLSITRGKFTLYEKQNSITYTTLFNGTYGSVEGSLRFHVTVDNGRLIYGEQKIFDNFSASLHSSISHMKDPIIHAIITGQLTTPMTNNTMCHIDGQWHVDKGQLLLHTSDNTYSCSFYDWKKIAQEVSGTIALVMPLNNIVSLFPPLQLGAISGKVNLQASVKLDNSLTLHSQLVLHDLQCNGLACGNGTVDINYREQQLSGLLKYFYSNSTQEDLTATMVLNTHTQEGAVTINAQTSLAVEPVGITLDTCTLQADLRDGIISGDYKVALHKTAGKDMWELNGRFEHADYNLTLAGNCNKKIYTIVLDSIMPLHIKKCVIHEDEKRPLFEVTQKGSSSFEGKLNFELLQEIIKKFFNYRIHGEGILSLTTENNGTLFRNSITLKEGNIRVPGTYTLLQGLTGTIDIDVQEKTITIHDLVIELDRGTLECSRAVIYLNSAMNPTFVYFPIQLKKAFLTLHKDLFAVISGSLLYTQEDVNPKLQGNLIIERGYCKKNIFSQVSSSNANFTFLNEFVRNENQDYLCDLIVETKKPLDVKTSFLDTQVQIDCALKGSIHNPELSGTLNLPHGTLAFPYRPLTITHGSIYFLPHQLYDPSFELIAKGKVRKYHITLRCSGSLQHPSISFESNPPLSEEQIITLLIAGSEEGSLSLAMPALIMQKLQNVILGPEQSPLKLEGYFKSLLEPLKHIRFIPGFSDQSGRGGFRGSIEIDVNDQLRAMIQKNFSLTEDIKFEVEYFLSDDITIRGIRDERADFGGEIEMRWKF